MIDFHTHIFPDIIAGKTLQILQSKSRMTSYAEGTSKDLLRSMEESDIELSVVLPVVTKPSQFESINRFAEQFCGDKLLSFGGIHPDSDNYKEELRYLKDHGFIGIKLHPDYQETFIDDIQYKRIISYASELGFIISVHAGFDPGYPDCVHCTPDRARKVIEELKPPKMVLAHMGGFKRWDAVEQELVGLDVWLDTAVVFKYIDDKQFIRICRNHGVEKILFATDSPWLDQKEAVRYMKRMDLSEEEKQLIFSENAKKLLTL